MARSQPGQGSNPFRTVLPAPDTRTLSRLVTSIEVHEDPRPGRKRPGAKLEVRGNLEALLTLTRKVESGGSPGGILPPLTFQLPPRVITLHRRHGSRGAPDEQRRAVVGA